MLDLLEQYAVREGLVAEPGFKAKTARWLIALDSNGAFESVIPPRVKGEDFQFTRCPELTFSELKALGGLGAHPLLSDCASVVLLTDKEEIEPDAKQQAKHQFFVERMQEVAIAASSFQPVADALIKPETLLAIRSELRRQKAKPTDKTTFVVGAVRLIDTPDWLDWWRIRRVEIASAAFAKGGRKAKQEASERQMVCLVTGQPTIPLATHPKISGLVDVGAQPMVPFLGFDKEAFRSYGLEQSANAAVSEEAAYTYRAALDDLMRKSERLVGMRVAHWFDKVIPPGYDPLPLLFDEQATVLVPASEDDALAFLFDDFEPDAATQGSALEQARRLLRSLKENGPSAQLALYRYYALSLSGAGGRVMVRDWMTGSFEELAASIAQWFEDFDITPLGEGKTPTPLLWKVISSALSPAETGDKSVGSLKIPLWKAALTGTPIPDAAVTRILNLHRAFIVTGEIDNTKRKTHLPTLYIRMGLLKAWLIRKGHPMPPNVTPEYESSAYHAGRLIAMLAALQRTALPDVDAGVAQRYYGAASVTPRLVIGRLTRLAQHHVAKVASDRKGLAYWYETRIGEIVTQINAGKALPATFNTQEQTEFALGYYQQIADNRSKKPDKNGSVNAEAEPEPGAPSPTDSAE